MTRHRGQPEQKQVSPELIVLQLPKPAPASDQNARQSAAAELSCLISFATVQQLLGLVRYLSSIGSAHFPHNVTDMDLHRTLTHVELISDYFVGFALMQERQDSHLPRRQRVLLLGFGRGRFSIRLMGQQLIERREHTASLDETDGGDGNQDACRTRRDEAMRTTVQRATDRLWLMGFFRIREDNDREVGDRLVDRPDVLFDRCIHVISGVRIVNHKIKGTLILGYAVFHCREWDNDKMRTQSLKRCHQAFTTETITVNQSHRQGRGLASREFHRLVSEFRTKIRCPLASQVSIILSAVITGTEKPGKIIR